MPPLKTFRLTRKLVKQRVKDNVVVVTDLFSEGDYESMEPIYKKVFEGLSASVVTVSVLGDFQSPLTAFTKLIKFPMGAKAFSDNLNGMKLNGRGLETSSILGAFFHVSALPDQVFKSLADVGQEYFSVSSSADVLSSLVTVRRVVNQLQNGLTEVVNILSKNGDREKIMQYLADLINKNASRSHIQVDPLSCASAGMFINLSMVMRAIFGSP